ncbi:entericidin A/B family lipoprotein [Sphingosinicella rhizophila]|uniref:Entericidin A/B family lipoprotein n=1 Tax=Sphingosinicella rhizophila TaxID=3050082 RepID=A0ABU3Q3T4_9SPHN|nr:entericidin A/B family lipoprotein [Sphingosinicella sp. GR2756]MDT9598061.1 entericidin A/B family lipoprotein [Sphingosinicella sp. GR2756]
MVRKLITLVALSTGLMLAACNTVRGAGEDIESVGETGDRVTE